MREKIQRYRNDDDGDHSPDPAGSWCFSADVTALESRLAEAEIDRKFYELAIKERDYERVRNARLEADIEAIIHFVGEERGLRELAAAIKTKFVRK